MYLISPVLFILGNKEGTNFWRNLCRFGENENEFDGSRDI